MDYLRRVVVVVAVVVVVQEKVVDVRTGVRQFAVGRRRLVVVAKLRFFFELVLRLRRRRVMTVTRREFDGESVFP